MRGKPPPCHGCCGCRRNIPAHAGKTCMQCMQLKSEAEHPRACGENLSVRMVAMAKSGTSPRMRGKHKLDERLETIRRNIPAHAGKTGGLSFEPDTLQEHPRACGENCVMGDAVFHSIGTSPRMRGKPFLAHLGAGAEGNIPAHAGKTASLIRSIRVASEHPRACGENPPAISRKAS